MTPFPHTVHLEDGITRAQEIMLEHDLRHVPVEEGGEIVGLVSQRDVEPRLAAGGAKLPVREVCSRDPYVVDLDERLDRVLLEMADRRIASALVTRRNRLVGIFTTTDACRVLAQSLRSRFAPRGGDDAA
jgi:acetoin utilization protein AcuB